MLKKETLITGHVSVRLDSSVAVFLMNVLGHVVKADDRLNVAYETLAAPFREIDEEPFREYVENKVLEKHLLKEWESSK